jgi:hypothetical protein
MDTLLSRFREKVNSVITGFDRIVFKGMVRPIMYDKGMESFLISRKVLNRDFKDYAVAQSKAIVTSAEEIAKAQSGHPIEYIKSLGERKEALAHKRQEETGIKEGLIGIWSCVESCNTFKSTFDPSKTYPSLRFERSKCKHLYFYFDDPVYGFMSVRLQTWAPYEIQVALNGRQWLRRSLDASGCGYLLSGNKFLHIDDYDLAQKLLDAQLKVDFGKVLNGFLPAFFPVMPEVIGNTLSYYWTFWQSEIAKDYIFKDSGELGALMYNFQLHALITGTGERILKYFQSPVRADGQPYRNTAPEILSRIYSWDDGLRVRHWNSGNSVKFYNEANVLRFETTINNPRMFKIFRHSEEQTLSEPMKLMPMRKGIADTEARADVSISILNRFTEQMSTVKDKTLLGKLLSSVDKHLINGAKRTRPLDVFGKDKEFLSAISDPAFNLHSITNKELQKMLKGSQWAKGLEGKRLSGRITRHLALLRKHGLIEQLPRQKKYVLTEKGRTITTALNVSLAASVEQLLDLAA